MTHVNRRQLIKVAALSAGTLGSLNITQALASDAPAKNTEKSVGSDVDVLIVGAGNAGIPAAIQAADLGASDELKEKYNRKIAKSKVICLPHATGDGIVMAEQIGANLVNMNMFISFPGAIEGSSGCLQHPPKNYSDGIWVNKQGRRFVNEHTDNPDEREQAFLAQTDFGFFYIIDESIRKSNKLGVIKWTEEKLQREIANGIVKKAQTINLLANKIGVNAKTLAQTVTAYNEFVSAGMDKEFNRTKLNHKLVHGPFYSIPITGSILISHGGIAVNHALQVTDNNGKVIPGLYAVGETLGSAQMMGSAVLSGMSVGSAITLGRIAARNACQFAHVRNAQSEVCEKLSI